MTSALPAVFSPFLVTTHRAACWHPGEASLVLDSTLAKALLRGVDDL